MSGPPPEPQDGIGPSEDKPKVKEINVKGIHAEFLEMTAYYLKYEYRNKDMTWGICMILLCILLIVICMILNVMVFKFYWKKVKSDVVSLLYTLLASADFFVAVGATLTVICLTLYLALDMEAKDKDYVYPSLEFFCYASFFISSIAIRISIFVNAMLSIVRTIMIRNPFSEINKIGICVALGLITFFWLLMTAGEVYTQKKINIELHWAEYEGEEGSISSEENAKNRKQYLYLWYFIYTSAAGFYHLSEFLGDRLPWSVHLYPSEGKDTKKVISESVALYGLFFIGFVIPCLIAIACLIVKAISLRKPGVGGTATEKRNSRVTNTIIMLTLVFVICNTINIVVISVAMWYPDWFLYEEASSSSDTPGNAAESPQSGRDSMAGNGPPEEGKRSLLVTTKSVTDDDVIITFYRSMFAVQQILPLLNSTLSPIILVWRGSAIRKHTKATIFQARQSVTANSSKL